MIAAECVAAIALNLLISVESQCFDRYKIVYTQFVRQSDLGRSIMGFLLLRFRPIPSFFQM